MILPVPLPVWEAYLCVRAALVIGGTLQLDCERFRILEDRSR